MKNFLKNSVLYNFNTVKAFWVVLFLSGCSDNGGSSHLTPSSGKISSLVFNQPYQIVSFKSESNTGYVLITNSDESRDINNVAYSITSVNGDAGRVTIESSSALQCTSIKANDECTLKLDIPSGIIGGSFRLVASNTMSSGEYRKGSATETMSKSTTFPIGVNFVPQVTTSGPDGINLSYYDTVIYGTAKIVVTGTVVSPNAGSFNSVVLLDENNQPLARQEVISNNLGARQAGLGQYSTFALVLPAPELNRPLKFKLQTSTVTENNATKDKQIGSRYYVLKTVKNQPIIYNYPAPVYLSKTNVSQAVLIVNQGDITAKDFQTSTTSEQIKQSAGNIPLNTNSSATKLGDIPPYEDRKIDVALISQPLIDDEVLIDQSLMANGEHANQNLVVEISSTDSPQPVTRPAIIVEPINNWQTMMGSAYRFTARINAGYSTLTPKITTGLAGGTVVLPASCNLDSISTPSCTFIIAPYVGLENYSYWNPAVANSSNPSILSNAYTQERIGLQLSATNNATINGNISPQIVSVNGVVTVPYIYLAAPNEGVANESNVGITWGNGGVVNPRFSNGNASDGTACPTGEEVRIDNLTGLMWVQRPNGNTYSWANAQSSMAIPASYCGYTDWRLPTINELLSLFNYGALKGNQATWLNSQGFTVFPQNYWSATAGSIGAWAVGVTNSVSNPSNVDNTYGVWPVRGGNLSLVSMGNLAYVPKTTPGNAAIAGAGKEWPDARFVADEDCVVDKLTGLMWARNGSLLGKGSWGSSTSIGTAQYKVTQMNTNSSSVGYQLCGYSDWRVPNQRELLSLTNYAAGSGNLASWLNSQGFIDVQAAPYWSATVKPMPGIGLAWGVNMARTASSSFRIDDKNYIWPVRGGR